MNYLSIAIPTYEMNGMGSKFLEFSFEKLKLQTFTDFQVVVSDHSKNDDVKSLCENWSDKLNIKYIRNEESIGSSSANINNVISNSDGKWIKIIFQDDFLYDNESLLNIYNSIKDTNKKWLVSACEHSTDGFLMYRPFYPRWNDDMQYGNNTISSPSVLCIKNEDTLFFDNRLIWLMDVEYYKRLYDNFGEPILLNKICVVNRTWANQLTNKITEKIKNDEYLLMRSIYDSNRNI